MKSVGLMLALVASSTALAQSNAQLKDVETFDGSFTGIKETLIVNSGALTGKWLLRAGKIHLERAVPRYPGDYVWTGTAEATQTVYFEIDAKPGKATIKGQGHSIGPAKMKLTPRGYQIEIRLPDIDATESGMTFSGPRIRQIKTGFGSAAMSGVQTSGSYDVNESETKSLDNVHRRSFTWSLHGVPGGDLVAVPKVSAVVRGQKSHLDGTESRKRERIKSYRWTLKPTADCPAGVPSKSFDQAEVDVLLLCSMQSTLVVSDGPKSSKEVTVEATVRSRDWKTERAKAIKGPDRIPALGLTTAHMLFGEAICAVTESADADSPGHVIHTDTPSTWRRSSYDVNAVSDPTSPFDGWYWLSENKSRYGRRIRLNRELYEASSTGVENAKSIANAKDLARIKTCVERHEREHDTQIQKRLASGWDPIRKVEKMIGKNESALVANVDFEFRAMEEKFRAANFFETDVQKAISNGGCQNPATIRIKNDRLEFRDVTFPKVSDMGDAMRQ